MRKAFWLVAAATVLLFPTAVLADSISPSSFSTTIAVGGTATVDKTVTVNAGAPTSALVDVFFLADTTGSMGGTISAVQASAGAILSSTAGLGDVQFAVGEYKDFGFGDPYAYRLNTALTGTLATAQAGINLWAASGGADTPEAQLYALQQVADTTTWRTGSTRIVVWFGDAPGHDPSGGVTEVTATASLVAEGILVEAISVGFNQLDSTGQATRIAAATGGTFQSGINDAAIVAAITAAINSAFLTYGNVTLDLSEVPAGLSASIIPSTGYTGSYDRSIDRTFGFDLSFTGLVAGTYDFNVYALVDGGRIATEVEHIVVGGAVPEPGTLLLLGSGLIGLAGYRRRARKM